MMWQSKKRRITETLTLTSAESVMCWNSGNARPGASMHYDSCRFCTATLFSKVDTTLRILTSFGLRISLLRTCWDR